MMHKKTIVTILFILFIGGCKGNLTTLRFDVVCKSKSSKIDTLTPDFYVDNNFVGSTKVDCDRYGDSFYVELETGIHNIRMSTNSETLYENDINILGERTQKVAITVNIP
ncbi:MAG: hypothetical protein WAX77_00150 [Methylococcaceae bacterium]